MTLAHGAASIASPGLVAMTNATVTNIAHVVSPLWTPITDTIEYFEYTQDDPSSSLPLLWMAVLFTWEAQLQGNLYSACQID